MTYSEYSQLLNTWEWKHFRKTFIESRRKESGELLCDDCGYDTPDETLHVHHRLYRRDALPWEYDFLDLRLICKECHAAIHRTENTCRFLIRILPPHVCHEFQMFLESLYKIRDPRDVKAALARANSIAVSFRQ